MAASPRPAIRKGLFVVASGRPPPGPARRPLLTSGPALGAAGRRRVAAAAVAR